MPNAQKIPLSDFIPERIRSVIATVFGITEASITDSTHFINDLRADSLDCVELIIALETEFRIDIHDDDAEHIYTVKDIADYIYQQLSRAA